VINGKVNTQLGHIMPKKWSYVLTNLLTLIKGYNKQTNQNLQILTNTSLRPCLCADILLNT